MDNIVIFRIKGSPRVLAASCATEMAQEIFHAANSLKLKRVSIQIGMARSWGDGMDWGDIALINGLGRWHSIEIKTILSSLSELWCALQTANEKWQQQKMMVDAFSECVAAPAPLRLVGTSSHSDNCRNFAWLDGRWAEIK